jgi:hypothetical protein
VTCLDPSRSLVLILRCSPPQLVEKEVASTMAKRDEIISIVRSLEGHVRKEYKAEVIGVFGSYARGEQTAHSDVDVLVRFLDGATLFDFVGLGDFLEDELRVKVDIVSERAIREELREQILREVVTV